MSLNIDKLSKDMLDLYNCIILKSKFITVDTFKESLNQRHIYLKQFLERNSDISKGSLTKEAFEGMGSIATDFLELYNNFDDKLMVFVVGSGNAGKSTLINALVGSPVAKTNMLPNTWKIDVYTPELDKDKAIIKYKTGEQKVVNFEQAKSEIDLEEKKSKESKKKVNDLLKTKLKGITNKEEREEIKKLCERENLYVSDVSEVRWPVESNNLLEKCLLVDTPGLVQYLDSTQNRIDVNNYYSKADGVIWILSGLSISSEGPDKMLKELDDYLANVGGIRNNIIGVVNRMDLVRKNGGQEDVDKVYNDAKRIFEDKFTNIIPMSAKQACEGIFENDKSKIEQSGITKLQNAIRDIFIAKADSIKSSGKNQGNTKLLKSVNEIIDKYEADILAYEDMYNSKKEELNKAKDKLVSDIKKDLNKFYKKYLKEVDERINLHIDKLSEGQGVDFVKQEMYKLDAFERSQQNFIQNKELELKNHSIIWRENCKISEYKYIKVDLNKGLFLINISDIKMKHIDSNMFFTPKKADTLMNTIGNLWGKFKFWILKGEIIKELNLVISDVCDKSKESIMADIQKTVDAQYSECIKILDKTFEQVIFEFNEVQRVKDDLSKLKSEINKESEELILEDLVGLKGIEKYKKEPIKLRGVMKSELK